MMFLNLMINKDFVEVLIVNIGRYISTILLFVAAFFLYRGMKLYPPEKHFTVLADEEECKKKYKGIKSYIIAFSSFILSALSLGFYLY